MYRSAVVSCKCPQPTMGSFRTKGISMSTSVGVECRLVDLRTGGMTRRSGRAAVKSFFCLTYCTSSELGGRDGEGGGVGKLGERDLVTGGKEKYVYRKQFVITAITYNLE